MTRVSSEAGSRPRRFGEGLALLVAAGSILGLLCLRIEPFDDGALLMGARMARAGARPYLDFYTLYGPFGYTSLGWVFGAVGNPPLALRVSQALLFTAVALLALLLDRRSSAGGRAWGSFLFVLALSAAAPLASFPAFALAVASLLCFALGDADAGPASAGWTAACGALLALAALTRPAFALYCSAGLLLSGIVGGTSQRRRLGIVALTAAATLVLVWASAYGGVPPKTALAASLLAPGRLATSGARYHAAPFLQAPAPVSFVWGACFVAALLPWTLAAASRRERLLAAAAAIAGGLAPLWLRAASAPGRAGTMVAGATLIAAGGIAFLERGALRTSPRLRAAALLGITAAALSHYFWVRQDRAHVLPLVALAAGSAALALERLRLPERAAAAVLLLMMFAPAGATALPIAALWDGGLSRLLRNGRAPGATLASVWPCAEVPADAARAVALADRGASPSSRFVAVGSSQAQSAINPVLLFLLSRRLPYTKWYTYDPGVQDSAPVQAEMARDLEASGSATAVVWRAAGAGRSAFDAEFDRLYPTTVERFGDYELRRR